MTHPILVTQSLISVSDKNGVVSLAKALCHLKVQLLSTGGTQSLLTENNIVSQAISNYTGFPEILDGRVKTLHPKIFGGLLHRGECDQQILEQHEIAPIQLVVVNLYPFESIVANPHQFEDAIENIDIGGVSLIRAAAKNFQHVAVITDPKDYSNILAELENNHGFISYETRRLLAQKAFALIARYDAAIANYLLTSPNNNSKLPAQFHIHLPHAQSLRYGENPHQKAIFYGESFNYLQGKPLSYNNLIDAQTAFECLQSFQEKPACVIVKHANPCGVAEAESALKAYQLAFDTDPVSAFGGIIGFNCIIQETEANFIIQNQFVEVLIAPEFSEMALRIFNTKPNLRLLTTEQFQTKFPFEFRSLANGVLLQEPDRHQINLKDLTIVTEIKPNSQQISDLLLAWKAIRNLKSNAIVLAKNSKILAFGGGQTSRVDAVRLAIMKAQDRKHDLQNSALASDAFFPFKDGVELAQSYGVTAIIQPGGSIRDAEIIQTCNQLKIAMAFTGVRHFRH